MERKRERERVQFLADSTNSSKTKKKRETGKEGGRRGSTGAEAERPTCDKLAKAIGWRRLGEGEEERQRNREGEKDNMISKSVPSMLVIEQLQLISRNGCTESLQSIRLLYIYYIRLWYVVVEISALY